MDSTPATYQVGDWLLSTRNRTLSCADVTEQLPAKVFAVLLVLIKNNQRIVTKEELIEQVWQGNVEVGLRGAANAIWQLRKVFSQTDDDSNKENEYIKTFSKVGYQLVQPVNRIVEQPTAIARSIPPLNGKIIATIGVFLTGVIIAVIFQVNLTGQKNNGQMQQEITRLTDFEGAEESPSISADGKFLAFQHITSGQPTKILIKNLNDPNAAMRQLTKSHLYESNPVWSPDNKQVAFLQYQNNGDCSVHVYRFELHESQKLTDDCFPLTNFNQALSWSPNGNFLAYVKKTNNGAAIFSIDIHSLTQQQITFPKNVARDTQIQWIADNVVVFVRDVNSKADIFITNLKGNVQQITHDELSIYSLVWHRARERIIYSVEDRGKKKVRALDLENSSFETLNLPTGVGGLAYNPINQQLVFARSIALERIWLVNTANGQVDKILASSFRNLYGTFVASKNGLIYTSNRSGNWELWLKSKGDSRQLTDNIGFIHPGVASPIDNRFALPVKQDNEKYFTLFVGDIDSGHIEKIPTFDSDVLNLSWSADGKSIYFSSSVSGEWQIYSLTLATSAIERITDQGGYYAIEEDDRHLLLTKAAESGLWRFNISEKTYHKISDKLAARDWGNFVVVDDGIWMVNRNSDSEEIIRINKTGKETVLLRYPKNTIKHNRSISQGPLQEGSKSVIITLAGSNEIDIFTSDYNQQN